MTGVCAVLAAQVGIQASASPADAYGFASTPVVQSNFVTVTVSPPGSYTYSWSAISSSPKISASLPSSDSTLFQANLSPGESVSGTWKCEVRAGGLLVSTVQVPVSLERA